MERLHTELRRHRVSKTSSRDEVYVALGRLGPCAMKELVASLSDRMALMTVYRTVNLLLKIGVAARVNHDLFELQPPFRQHHHHFRCRECGRRIDFYDERLENDLLRIAKGRSLILESHQIEMMGLCLLCEVN